MIVNELSTTNRVDSGSQPAGPQTYARPTDCPNCHGVAFVLTDTFTCREQCFSCGRCAIIGWSSFQQPVLVLADSLR